MPSTNRNTEREACLKVYLNTLIQKLFHINLVDSYIVINYNEKTY